MHILTHALYYWLLLQIYHTSYTTYNSLYQSVLVCLIKLYLWQWALCHQYWILMICLSVDVCVRVFWCLQQAHLCSGLGVKRHHLPPSIHPGKQYNTTHTCGHMVIRRWSSDGVINCVCVCVCVCVFRSLRLKMAPPLTSSEGLQSSQDTTCATVR